jgi:hypothetical protein
MTFNANMVSIDTGDVRAVYQIRDADTNSARAMFKTERTPLPNSSPSKYYPDTTYLAASGIQSGAETISYYLRRDSTTTRSDDYLLFRRVNALTPTLVARSIVRMPSRDTMPFFTYYKADTLNRLVAIPRNTLPLYHGIIHGAVDDTGRFARTDSVRAVRVHFLTAARDPRTNQDALRTVETMVRMMNSGLLDRTSCGQPPYSGGTPTAVASVVSGSPRVTVSWTKSTDDNSGERDIERYAIFRRPSSVTVFGDPISSIPGRLAASYSFVDNAVVSGQTYVYGIAAQDCTPSLSNVVSSVAVTIP